MPHVLVFDVNETLLDLGALDLLFEQTFGDRRARKAWFAQMLRTAFVSVITDRYADFGAIGRAALEMTARRRGLVLEEADYERIVGGMRRLPPHPDVPASFERLREAGLRLAALTNSTKVAADAQLTHAGLFDYFEQVLSVEAAGCLKPHPRVYRTAAAQLGVEAAGLRLIAAHNWDITGAMRAGWAGAFIARPGMVLGALDEQPDIVGANLGAVVDQILDKELGGAG